MMKTDREKGRTVRKMGMNAGNREVKGKDDERDERE